MVDGKETLWRYCEGYDPYAKKGEGSTAITPIWTAGGPQSGRIRTRRRLSPAMLST